MITKMKVIFLLSTFSAAFGRFRLGKCPKVFALPNVNLTELAGDWYEVEKFEYRLSRMYRKCGFMSLTQPAKELSGWSHIVVFIFTFAISPPLTRCSGLLFSSRGKINIYSF